MTLDVIQFKQQAAEKAVEYVEPGMVVGLGHGTTAIFAVRRIAHLLQTGQLKNIRGVPCSRRIEAEAQRLGIPLAMLDELQVIDLTIDGADEVDPHLNLIKGGGGALLREKMIAQASRREIIVVDESKLSPALGTHYAVPVEVVEFGWKAQVMYLSSIGGEAVLRHNEDGTLFYTDQGNLILDARFGPMTHPEVVAQRLDERAGIVEHGLFLGLASEVIVAGEKGIRHLVRGDSQEDKQ
jgi:ribose 5-phosphate isomerase A